jgi:hypothetical protein
VRCLCDVRKGREGGGQGPGSGDDLGHESGRRKGSSDGPVDAPETGGGGRRAILQAWRKEMGRGREVLVSSVRPAGHEAASVRGLYGHTDIYQDFFPSNCLREVVRSYAAVI